MMDSVAVLTPMILMLFMVDYLFSIILLQCILDSEHWMEFLEDDRMYHFFGSLPRVIFTLFKCVVGGVNWDDVATPLMRKVSPLIGVVFTIYIAFCMFAIMNMLTGVFVDQAMEKVREDKDYIVAKQIRDIFLPEADSGESVSEEIDWDTFQLRMQSPIMQDYLAMLGLSAAEANGLFHLLDRHDRGTISSQDIVDGCLRLHGPARTLDLALMRRELSQLKARLHQVPKRMSAGDKACVKQSL